MLGVSPMNQPNHHLTTSQPIDLAALRARLEGTQGLQYWRSLDELAQTDAFQEWLHHEFPEGAWPEHDAVSRRRFLQLMGASVALAGLTACTRQPEEHIVPYVQAPEETVPGKPQFYATAMPMSGTANGVLVESHMGRPTKIEGNPQHPASLGATDCFAQASVLSLYDPDRSQAVLNAGQISTWSAFLNALSPALEAQRVKRGAGLRVLTETVLSPTMAQQIATLRETLPAATWHQYEPINRDAVYAGTRMVFGQDLNPLYRFDRAEVMLVLDAEILTAAPGSLRYARDFAAKRRVRDGGTAMNRLYAVESTPTLTGAMADHRLPLRASDIVSFAHALARTLGVTESAPPPSAPPPAALWPAKWIDAVASDLQQHRGASIVVAGEQQPAVVHALAQAMNDALGNIGSTVVYTAPVEAIPVGQLASLQDLVRAMAADEVELLVILGGNPVYTAPADLGFAEQLAKVPLRLHLSLYDDETSTLCHWHIPEAHYLETWSDTRTYDGTVSIVQPLIAPLYGGKSAHEMLAVLGGQPDRSSYAIVQDYWRSQFGEADFARVWRTALHDGVVAETALPPVAVERQPLQLEQDAHTQTDSSALELIFRPDPTVWDGRFSNNGWLQELPKPLSKLTWDNAAFLSPATAARLGLHNEDEVELSYQGRRLQAPVWVLPGHVDNAVTVHLGYGRWRGGRVGSGTGFNAYTLRTSAAPWFAPDVELRPTGNRFPLATTQHHASMEGRHLVREATLTHFLQHPHFVHDMAHDPPVDLTLYPHWSYPGYAWGMAIDLNACIGCNACTIACQAENNIPIVGKSEVARGREMHWLRLDRYYQGEVHNPQTVHQPVLCMHCENAPCELVCPVAATVHSDEGLNDMVYNRCVGTRYCSNNCPYKVRRFNFFQYADYTTSSLKLMRNPDVTVRTRGVMEKCTYCVQRINAARIQAKLEDRSIRDGDVVTACQAACPTDAIVFGNINDAQSRVANLKASPLNYGLLTELNTRPRTTYLAKLRNPNPELTPGEPHSPPNTH
jgi:molybdopterin-containing oxidoreductase family iron-sulfur binding subunit